MPATRRPTRSSAAVPATVDITRSLTPPPTRLMAAVRVRPLVGAEVTPTSAHEEVIRVVAADGCAAQSADVPHLLEVVQPSVAGRRGGRASLRPAMAPSSHAGAGDRAQTYAFDCCAGPATTQEEFFAMLKMPALCEAALAGEVVTVFCFGQTGGGKTHTLSGATLETSASPTAAEAPAPLVAEDGLQYQAVRYLAQRLKELRRAARKADGGPVRGGGGEAAPSPVTARCSYVELYQERLYDLLQPDGGGDAVRCRWSAATSSFFVAGSLLVECRGRDDFLAVLREGQRGRQRGCHALNRDSSRSHVVFTVVLEASGGGAAAMAGAPPSTSSATRYGRLVFVDLAGSERLKMSRSASAVETGAINKSLFTLGHVLELLAAAAAPPPPSSPSSPPPPPPFIPYRSSVLTQLLMQSLDGHGRTLMIACVSPSALHAEESLRTLHYAERATHIRATPVVHVDAATQQRMTLEALVRQLQRENAVLRRALELPLVGAVEEEEVSAQLAALRRAWATVPADTTQRPSSMPPRSTPALPVVQQQQQSAVVGRPASRASLPRAAHRIAAAAAAAAAASASASVNVSEPADSTAQTVVMSPTASDADVEEDRRGPASWSGSGTPQAAAGSILALLEALPDTRSMHA
ncbi:kinesin-like protein [Novymonas esmeraldas]|uniref:Kinesin-like protein n=1 Tax=Novymonas esmeraldas TaxID=1808958 RepID=A0AAW0EY61_9TRYP